MTLRAGGYAAVMAALFSVSISTVCVASPIKRIIEAGIYCTGSGNSNIGPRFYRYVKHACDGNAVCRVRPTAIASLSTLRSMGCTGFFVIARCGGGNRDFESKTSLSKKLRVSCS